MPKIVNHTEYKEEILTRCFDLFAQRGYSAITMREIAKGLNISTGSLYHYFPSKQEIFQKMLAMFSERDASEVITQIAPARNLEERIDIIFGFVESREVHFRNLLFLVVDYYRHHEIQTTDFAVKEIMMFYKQTIHELTGLDGENTVSNFIYSIFAGIIFSRLIDAENVKFDEMRVLVKEFLLNSKMKNQME